MPYWCAAFGANDSYFFNSPHKWSMCGLPDRIISLFNTEPKAKEIHEIALGPNGSYAIIFSDQTGIKVRHSGLPPPVEKWLLNHSGRAINAARDLATMQITLGPNGSYFSFDKNGCIWGGLPPGLQSAIDERRDSNGCFKPGAYPYLVSLGAEGTYAMFTIGGSGSWNFGGKQQLDQYLKGLSSLMHVGVILSPFDVKHFLLVTGQGVTAGVCPDVCTAAYMAFADDWRSSVEAEVAPPPPPRPPPQTEIAPQLPPRRPSSIAAEVQTRHSYVAYSPNPEHRPSLPPRPFSDSTTETFHNTPWNSTYVAYSPPSQTSPQLAPSTSLTPGSLVPPAQNVSSFPPPPIHRRPVSSQQKEQNQLKEQSNPYTLSPIPPPPVPAEKSPPPPYTPTSAVLIEEKGRPLAPSYNSIPSAQTLQAQQTNAAAQAQAKAAAKAKRDQRIKTGLKMGKMAMQGLAIGAAIVNIASGNGGDIPSFDSGGPDVPDVPDMSVPDTSAYWQPLQDCASMPIQ